MRASRGRQRGQVVILILLGVFPFGASAGGSGWMHGKPDHELRKALETIVPDEARRASLDATVVRLDGDAKELAADFERRGKEILALLERHDATRAEVERAFADSDARGARTRQALLASRQALRAQLGAAEWRALFPEQAP